jgi:hypothetical protein
METNKKCEKCKKSNALYSGKCKRCDGRNQCEKIKDDGTRCKKCAYNNEKFCAEHGGCPKCTFVYKSLKTGPEQCETNACRKGGVCSRHSKPEKRDSDEKLLVKPIKRYRLSSTIIESETKEPLSKKRKNESPEPKPIEPKPKPIEPIITTPIKPKPIEEMDLTGIDAEGILEAETSFTGENPYDTTYKEKGGRILRERIKTKEKESIGDFLKGIIFSTPKKGRSDDKGKPQRMSKKSRRKSKKKSRRKSRRKSKKKSRRKSRRKSSRRNTYIKV